MPETHGDHHDLWIDPTNPLRMINGNDGGGVFSVNGGHTWTETVDRFRNDSHEDDPGWAPHYQCEPEPTEHVP